MDDPCFTLTNGYHWGGGGVSSEASGVVANCTISRNAGSFGGGAYGGTLYNCTLTGNGVHWAPGNPATGGGAYNSTLYNCTLTGNYSGRDGGGASYCTLYNCTLTRNWSYLGGGGAYGSTLYNCIVYHNTAPNGANYYTGMVPDWGGEFSTVLQHCCTTPLPTNGLGNITGPPLFMDMAAGDFRLREESPCIDAGTNLVGVIVSIKNPDDWGFTLAPYPHEPTDILDNTRFIDGNGDGKVAWDIGAHEFNSFPPPRFTSPPPQLTEDRCTLTITGAPNKKVRLQRSSNLKDWEDVWCGGMGFEGVKQVTDLTDMWLEPEERPKVMFYRVVVVP